MVAQRVFFYLIAAVMAVSALRVVTTKNVVHAALYLVMVLAGAAALFVLLAAEFLAAVQVLVYIGAIVVLFLFGVMLTRAPIGHTADLDNSAGQRVSALVVGAGLLGLLGTILWSGYHRTKLDPQQVGRTSDVGFAIFRNYVIPFEVISILLTAALVGAIVLARRD